MIRRGFPQSWTAAALVSLAGCLGAILAWGAPAHAQQTSTPLLFAECERAVDDAALRDGVYARARDEMRRAAEAIDYDAMVRRSWLVVRFDAKFETLVDEKLAELRADRAYFERLVDANYPVWARQVAERSADAVFGSPEFASLQDELQVEIQDKLVPALGDAETDSIDVAAACVNTFLGARYAETLQTAFARGADTVALDPGVNTDGVETSVALNLAGVVGAILVIVFRRMVRRIVASAVRRLTGAIAARIAAWTSVILGIAFLAYELVAGADGVFPVIRAELLSPETKREMQTSLADELATVGPQELDARAQVIAAEMFARWRAFKEEHRVLLELADRSPPFKAFLGDLEPRRLETATVVVAALRREGGEPRVLAALESGELGEALSIRRIASYVEAWEPRGLTVGDLLAWRRASGGAFESVLALELPAVIGPDTLDRAELTQIARYDDAAAARAVAAMPSEARSDALRLSEAVVGEMTARLSSESLTQLFESVRPVADAGRRQAFLRQAADDPAALGRLSAARFDIAASRAPETALEILLDPAPLWSPFAVWSHGDAVLAGDVAPSVLAHRYGWALLLILGPPALIALWMLRGVLRLFGGRRR